jgi:quercetin dioxygenase-like cupin family protein
MFRIIDLTLEAHTAAITHKHGAGMNYAMSGPHLLTEAGQTTTLDVGQAAWVGEQAEHTHVTNGATASRWLFMFVLRPVSERGTPIAPAPGRTARVAFESEVLHFRERGAQEVILERATYQAGEAGATQSYAGPTLFLVEDGTITLTSGNDARRLHAGTYHLVQAGTPVQVQVDGRGTARLLTLAVVPAGQPVSVPVHGGPAPVLPATGTADRQLPLLALASVLLLGGTVMRRRMSAPR